MHWACFALAPAQCSTAREVLQRCKEERAELPARMIYFGEVISHQQSRERLLRHILRIMRAVPFVIVKPAADDGKR